MKTVGYISFFLAVSCLVSGCRKKEDPVDIKEPDGALKLGFLHLVGSDTIQFESPDRYVTQYGDSITIHRMAYYLSNVRLTNTSNEVYEVPSSYHLVEIGNTTLKDEITISGIPVGSYKLISFSVGVDSMKNHTIDHTGDLDPGNHMAWDWNIGYKFFVLEAIWQAGDSNEVVSYHVGEDHNYRTHIHDLTMNNQAQLHVRPGAASKIMFSLNLNDVLQGLPLSNARNRAIHDGPEATIVVDNLATGLRIEAIKN